MVGQMQRKYLVPQIGTNTYLPHGAGKELDIYRPKYFGDMTGVKWTGQDYSVNGLWLVTADLSDFDHSFILSQSDAFVFPDDPKQALDPAPLQAYLAGYKLPVGTLDAGQTYSDVLDKIQYQIKTTQILCGLQQVHNNSTLTVDSKFSDLAGVIQDLMKSNPSPTDSVFDILGKTSAASPVKIASAKA